ncbi:MAG: acyl-ACP thioesterase [Polyangiaceae bacterium]|nr:acyl-ACP thioesterase [Polyangiaceae bacterium]
MRSHRQIFDVHSYEVDPFDQLTLTALGAFLQEAAYNNVRALGWGLDELNRRGLTWVVSTMKIEVDAAIRETDRLEIETWPSGSERLAVLRDYEVRRMDGAVVARAASQWLILELERRRPVRPETVIEPELLAEAVHVLPPWRERLARLEQWDEERRLTVRYQDIDMNLHANNAAYLSWLVEALPEEVWRDCRLATGEVQYLAECRHDTTVRTRALEVAPGAHEHAVVREEDGKELVRARTRWVER